MNQIIGDPYGEYIRVPHMRGDEPIPEKPVTSSTGEFPTCVGMNRPDIGFGIELV